MQVDIVYEHVKVVESGNECCIFVWGCGVFV